MDEKVSVVCTSCGRVDLLEQTIESFLRYNHYPVESFIVVEDKGQGRINAPLEKKFRNVQFVYNEKRIGQIASIDKGYSMVKTSFIFHLEDDWQFYRSGFIEKSLPILKSNPTILQVWIRHPNDTNGHPHHDSGRGFRIMHANHINTFHGFSFNPGLRRLIDYKLVAPFSSKTIHGLLNPAQAEIEIGNIYYRMGFRSALLPEGYCRHIGWGRHVN